MLRFVRKYAKNGVQAGTLMGLGDVISQTYVEGKSPKDLDLYRTAKFGALGCFFVGPILGSWYMVLEKRIVMKHPGAQALAKMAADQFGFAPFFLYIFLWVNGLTSFKSVEQVKHETNRDYFTILKSNYKVWPAVQLLNFWVVPLHLRLLFVQTVAVFWNTYLSWMTNK